MDVQSGKSCGKVEEEMDLRKGLWTVEEDFTLINYIVLHGEGRWNSLARSAGLKRTGKSCRLRWLNYLRPDVRRGNINLEEQLLILELHSRWGNRWSKIAQYLPGRSDNEIKNYWRTRVQKQARQLKCDVNSKQFMDTMRYLWMPRLVERVQASASVCAARVSTTISPTAPVTNNADNHMAMMSQEQVVISPAKSCVNFDGVEINSSLTPQNSITAASSDSFGSQVSPVSDIYPANYQNHDQDYNYYQCDRAACGYEDPLTSPSCYFFHGFDFEALEQNNQFMDSGDLLYNLWNVEDYWYLDNQLINNV